MKRPELLCPAGSLPVLKTAVRYGADAVYIGGEAFGLRAKAKNFSPEDMAQGIAFAHEHGARVHVTANILAHDEDLKEAADYFRFLEEIRPDAVIVADPGMFLLARENCPSVPVHVSTQANNTNSGTFRFWYAQGAKRVVCARELSMEEIRKIRENVPEDLEIEAFVHGAMCISYSGRCLLSSYFTGRDANRGACTHPCRWRYSVMEETRPGEYLPVEENERGTYIFNSRDLCMIGHIPELIGAGVDSFKIEGRMKTALYAAVTARTYRQAIDDYLADPELYKKNLPHYVEEIGRCTSRKFTEGFYFGRPDETSMIYDSNTYEVGAVYYGTVGAVTEKEGIPRAVIEQKNKFLTGSTMEIMKPDGRNILTRVREIADEEGTVMESAPHPGQRLFLAMDPVPEEGDILRSAKEEDE